MRKRPKQSIVTESEHSWNSQQRLTVDDASVKLGLCRVKIYDLIKRDGLPSVKINGARRIQPGKLQSWIEQHCKWLYSSVFTLSEQVDAHEEECIVLKG